MRDLFVEIPHIRYGYEFPGIRTCDPVSPFLSTMVFYAFMTWSLATFCANSPFAELPCPERSLSTQRRALVRSI